MELVGVDNKDVKLRHVQITKPSVSLAPLKLEKLSPVSTTGTSTSILPAPFRGTTALATFKLYTVFPTKGTVIGRALQEADLSTGEWMNEHYGDEDGSNPVPPLQSSTESYAWSVTVASLVNGYVEWTEEPY